MDNMDPTDAFLMAIKVMGLSILIFLLTKYLTDIWISGLSFESSIEIADTLGTLQEKSDLVVMNLVESEVDYDTKTKGVAKFKSLDFSESNLEEVKRIYAERIREDVERSMGNYIASGNFRPIDGDKFVKIDEIQVDGGNIVTVEEMRDYNLSEDNVIWDSTSQSYIDSNGTEVQSTKTRYDDGDGSLIDFVANKLTNFGNKGGDTITQESLGSDNINSNVNTGDFPTINVVLSMQPKTIGKGNKTAPKLSVRTVVKMEHRNIIKTNR